MARARGREAEVTGDPGVRRARVEAGGEVLGGGPQGELAVVLFIIAFCCFSVVVLVVGGDGALGVREREERRRKEEGFFSFAFSERGERRTLSSAIGEHSSSLRPLWAASLRVFLQFARTIA